MSDFPSLQQRYVPYRGGASSETFNKTVEESFYDLNNLFNLLSDQDAAVTEAQSIFSVQTTFQQIRMDTLQAEIDTLKGQLEDLQAATSGYKETLGVGKVTLDATLDSSQLASIDAQYNVITLPVSGDMTSKVYLYDGALKQAFQPSTLKVAVEPAADGTTIVETDAKRAFDGDANTYWHRKYYFAHDDSTASVTAEVTVTLPYDIISNRDINMIYLNPFPLNTLIIDKVEYRLNGDWTLLPGFPTDQLGNPVPYQNTGYLKFHFPSVPMSEVRITVRQPHWVMEGNQKVFHVGLQEVGVFYVGYQTGVGKFQIPLVLRGKAGSHMITGIVPNFVNDGALSDKTDNKTSLFSYTVYQVDATGALTYTKDSLPIVVSTDTIMIKISIFRDPQTQATPALESITIKYQDA